MTKIKAIKGNWADFGTMFGETCWWWLAHWVESRWLRACISSSGWALVRAKLIIRALLTFKSKVMRLAWTKTSLQQWRRIIYMLFIGCWFDIIAGFMEAFIEGQPNIGFAHKLTGQTPNLAACQLQSGKAGIAEGLCDLLKCPLCFILCCCFFIITYLWAHASHASWRIHSHRTSHVWMSCGETWRVLMTIQINNNCWVSQLFVPWGLVGSRLFGRRGCDPGILPGGWFGIRREGLGPPGYRGDMNGCRKKDKWRTIYFKHVKYVLWWSWFQVCEIPW